MDKQEILEKTKNSEDKMVVSRLFDLIKMADRLNNIETTDFLDMKDQALLEKTLKKINFQNYEFFGGIENAERKILIIYPDKLSEIFENNYYNYNNIIDVIKINLDKENFGKYFHRTYLGALMKLGIKREKIGDIIVDDHGADVICKDVSKFLQINLTELTRFKKSEIVKCKLEDIREIKDNKETIKIIVPSLRLDSIVGELAHTSRIKALDLLKQERVFINFQAETKSSKKANIGDLITIRGKGRFKIINQVDSTKKGNIVIEVEKFI